MKKLALFSVLCTPLITANVWAVTSGQSAPAATINKPTLNNLTAHIVIVPGKGADALNNMKGTPDKSVNSVSQGSALSIFISFSDCAPNATGTCDVSVDFFVVHPDGLKKSGGSGVVWSGAPFSIPGLSLLGQASLTAGFDKNDPIGDYKVLADVTDKVSGKVLHLSQGFKVTK